MKKKKKAAKTTDELRNLAAAKKQLLELVSDHLIEQAETAISNMLAAQVASDIDAVEIYIPTKSVLRRVDLGPVELVESNQGVLFNAKGYMSTFIRPMVSTNGQPCGAYAILLELMDEIESDFKSLPEGEDPADHQAFAQAWLYILQAPIFCCLSPDYACDVATKILHGFNEYAKEHIDQAKLKDETKEDAIANAESGNLMTQG